MRVLLATHASLEVDSGEERALEDLGRHLLERGHEVRFANYEGLLDNQPRKTLREVREDLGAAEVVSVPAMPLASPFLAIPSPRGLTVLVASMRWADVIVFGQFYGFDVTMWALDLVVRRPLLCSQANALFRPFRATVRDALQEAYERTVGIALLRRFAAVRVCNSDDLRTLTGRGCRQVLLLYPPNTDLSLSASTARLSDPDRATVDWLSSDRRFKLLIAGRMTHQKGLDLLGEAILRIGADDPAVLKEVVFLFAGTRELPTALHGPAHRYPGLVVNLGVVPREAFPAVVNTVDAVVMPSRYESFGRVAAEAHSLGKPVVATNVTGLREVVVSGTTGILVDAWSPEALAAAVRTLHDTFAHRPEGWKAMQEAARARFAERFGSPRSTEQMNALVAMLERLAREPRRSGSPS